MRSDSSGPHAGQRLVQQQHLRIAGQRHGDLELPLLAVRQRAGDARRRRACRPTRCSALPAPRRSTRFRAMRFTQQVDRARVLRPATARRTFSSTVKEAKDVGSLVAAADAGARQCARRARRRPRGPSSSMRPADGRVSPDSMLTRVVLPAPLGPITACSSPDAARWRRRGRRPARRMRVRPCVASRARGWGAPQSCGTAFGDDPCIAPCVRSERRPGQPMLLKPFGNAISRRTRLTSPSTSSWRSRMIWEQLA